MKTIVCSNEFEAIREISMGGTIVNAHLFFRYPKEHDITCSVLEIQPAELVLIRLKYLNEAQARTVIDEYIWKEAEKAGFEYYGFRFAADKDTLFSAPML